jgi:hypothetical protein
VLTLTELVIERICDTIDSFPPLFARLCQMPGVVAPLMGGRVFKVLSFWWLLCCVCLNISFPPSIVSPE